MSAPTAARPQTAESAHWYFPDGKPAYEIPNAKGTGTRAPTIADARKLGLLPSSTTIIRGALGYNWNLVAYFCEHSVLAVVAHPDLNKALAFECPACKQRTEAVEPLDAFVKRVLPEAMEDRDAAAARGTALHEIIVGYALTRKTETADADLKRLAEPACRWLDAKFTDGWRVLAAEQPIVGDGYAGRLDLALVHVPTGTLEVLDIKTSKSPPKPNAQGEVNAYPEHMLQVASYAKPLAKLNGVSEVNTRCAVLYVPTVGEAGVVCAPCAGWRGDYNVFNAAFVVWRRLKNWTLQNTDTNQA